MEGLDDRLASTHVGDAHASANGEVFEALLERPWDAPNTPNTSRHPPWFTDVDRGRISIHSRYLG